MPMCPASFLRAVDHEQDHIGGFDHGAAQLDALRLGGLSVSRRPAVSTSRTGSPASWIGSSKNHVWFRVFRHHGTLAAKEGRS